MILQCHTECNDNGTVNIFAVWQIPEEAMTWLPETIDYFQVVPWLVDASSNTASFEETYSTIEVDVDVSNAY